MITYDFHPEVASDLDEIWDFIAADNPDAADRVIAEIVAAIDALVPFPRQGHRRPDLTSRPLRFIQVHSYLLTRRTKSRYGLWPSSLEAAARASWRRSSEAENKGRQFLQRLRRC
jgi:plasmid stabilization system protein ParE